MRNSHIKICGIINTVKSRKGKACGYFYAKNKPRKGVKPMSQKAFKSPAELAKKVDEYFAKCEASKQARELKVVMSGYAKNYPLLWDLPYI